MQRRKSQALLSVPRGKTRGNGHKTKQEVLFKHQKGLSLLCEGDQALPQVAMRSGEFSLLVDIQKPPGHRSEQLALGGPA